MTYPFSRLEKNPPCAIPAPKGAGAHAMVTCSFTGNSLSSQRGRHERAERSPGSVLGFVSIDRIWARVEILFNPDTNTLHCRFIKKRPIAIHLSYTAMMKDLKEAITTIKRV